MARDNLSACLPVTLNYEGGYVDNPHDPGGATNMGITIKTLAAWRKVSPWWALPKSEVKALKLSEAQAIYDRNYWQPINGELLPYGVDLVTFDAGVMSGPSRGAKWLQRAAGVKQDGKVGGGTLGALATVDPAQIVRLVCGYRLGFVQGLGTFKVFGRGWSRRIADIEAKGVAMWLRAGAGKSAAETADELARQAQAAREQADTNAKSAGGSVAGGAVAGGGDLASGGTGWLIAVGVVLILAAVLLWVKSRQNHERAEAYARAVDDQMLDHGAGQ